LVQGSGSLRPRNQSFRRSFRIRQTTLSILASTSCSHTATTRHPLRRSCFLCRISRACVSRILSRHQFEFDLGHAKCSGQPCQKHPSTNTQSFFPFNVYHLNIGGVRKTHSLSAGKRREEDAVDRCHVPIRSALQILPPSAPTRLIYRTRD
jgi:hypothetical protein